MPSPPIGIFPLEEQIIEYRITFPDGSHRDFRMDLDDPQAFAPDDLPEWTALDVEKCPNCPLSSDEHPRCPAAAFMAPVVDAVNGHVSHTRVAVTVTTPRRTVELGDVDLQGALSALMGMLLPLSGCPRLGYFRPMAHFHLPLASTYETLYRAASMYALAQTMRRSEGLPADDELEGLNAIYEEVKSVNKHLHRRLVDELATDSPQNAVAILDTLAWLTPMAVEAQLADLRHLFEPYLEE